MPRSAELVRSWRGLSPEQRVAQRREQLLEAALEVFTTNGFHATKVRDVCREAGLTERYFYESFTDKAELLDALGTQLVQQLVAVAAPGIALVAVDLDAGISAAMHAVVHEVTDDPRKARILFVESVGASPSAEDRRRGVIRDIVQLLIGAAEQAFGGWVRDSFEVELIARSVIGAITELLVAYARDELTIDQDELVVSLTRILLRARTVVVAIANEPDGIPPRDKERR